MYYKKNLYQHVMMIKNLLKEIKMYFTITIENSTFVLFVRIKFKCIEKYT